MKNPILWRRIAIGLGILNVAGFGQALGVAEPVHAGIHAVGSIPAYLIAGLGLLDIAILCVTEFVVHYLVDFVKVDLSGRIKAGPDTMIYWALHGGDQLLHQLTYSGLIFVALKMIEA